MVESQPIYNYFVIPAKAGIHHLLLKFKPSVMDPRLRGGDEYYQFRNCGFLGGLY